jgi:hypothetical protein
MTEKRIFPIPSSGEKKNVMRVVVNGWAKKSASFS